MSTVPPESTAPPPAPPEAAGPPAEEEAPPRPPIAASPLSVILPAHHAAASVASVLQGWFAYLDTLNRDYEILLVDDGSSDRTVATAEALAAEKPSLRVLKHDQQRGFGAALRTGLAAAKHPLVCYAACDARYPAAELAKLLERIDLVDLVSGFRGATPVPLPWRITGFLWRCLIRVLFGIPLSPAPGWLGAPSQAYQKVIRILFGVRIRDVDSPFKLFRRSIFERIPLQADGEFTHAEILAKANFLSCLMDEAILDIPATWQPDERRWTELRAVFREPDFGPAVLTPRVEG
ncbi:MAG: glycosyltransferase family 2 protein [Planctomycetia bacterium]|nr:glycosyltransferase family 2 protein [Planctomycetia bacterium]